MASPSTPTHGKLGAIYRRRPGGFVGAGLNDVTWGLAYAGAASAYFEVVIDAAGTPDTFKWRKDGGAWTAGVAITGAAQTLSDGQTVTCAATTCHAVDDSWAIGNLKAEAATESGVEAQVTAAANRILNPNSPPTWTDSGGETVQVENFSKGWAEFTGNVTVVTLEGNDGYVPAAALEKVGYLRDWSFSATVEMADASVMGEQWKTALPGLASFSGQAGSFFIGTKTFLDDLGAVVGGSAEKVLLKLFSYDPDQDGTGDHFICWTVLSGVSVGASLNEIVNEKITFSGDGAPSFTANA